MVVRLVSPEPLGPYAQFPEDTKVDSKACYYHTSNSDPGPLQPHFDSSQAGRDSACGCTCSNLSSVEATETFWSYSKPPAGRPKLKRKSKSESQVSLYSTGYEERWIVAKIFPAQLAFPIAANRSLTSAISLGGCELSVSPVQVHGTKRIRAFHDVDGPETHTLPCKKRRLRLYLVTSWLSQPFSLPATHILNRESNEGTHMLSRFLKLSILGTKRAGHQSSLIRKAAILNRVRIGVRQAAISRGHTSMANVTARGNTLKQGLQLVTASSPLMTGARFPSQSLSQDYSVPAVWQPHTTTFHPWMQGLFMLGQEIPGASSVCDINTTEKTVDTSPTPSVPQIEPRKSPGRPSQIDTKPDRVVEEDSEISFPASDLAIRYADLSDDDMDDVYADFGVLFGPGARSPEGEKTDEEHFYEEYLDELDGIQWGA